MEEDNSWLLHMDDDSSHEAAAREVGPAATVPAGSGSAGSEAASSADAVPSGPMAASAADEPLVADRQQVSEVLRTGKWGAFTISKKDPAPAGSGGGLLWGHTRPAARSTAKTTRRTARRPSASAGLRYSING